MVYTEILAIACLLSGGALLAVAAAGKTRVEAPAVGSFALAAATMGAGAAVVGVGIAFGSGLAVVSAVVMTGLVFPLIWVLFALEYVGREEFLSLRVAGVVAIPVLAGVVATGLRFGTTVVPWYELPSREAASGAGAVGLSVLELTQWFGLLYAGALLLAGAGAILWAFRRYQHLETATGTALGAFGTVPWVSLLFGLQLESVAPLALGWTVTVGFLSGAVTAVALLGPVPLFDRTPSAGQVGPRRVIEELDDLVVVLDPDGRVIELNASARKTLGGGDGVNGIPIEAFLGRSIAELREGGLVELDAGGGRQLFTARVSRLADRHDYGLGYAVVLRDVTERRSRQQLLDVFNRVLRHNLRNQVNVIVAQADLVKERTDDPTSLEHLGTITRISWELASLSEKARDAEQVFDIEIDSEERTSLAPLVERVSESFSEARIATRINDGRDGAPEARTEVVAVGPAAPIGLALRTLVENAVEHNDREEPFVRTAVEYHSDEPYPVKLAVADDGPGIPAAEQRAIEAGRETALEHGSGLGLWIVRLITTKLGGEMRFEDREPRGTVVSVHLPGARRAREDSEPPPRA